MPITPARRITASRPKNYGMYAKTLGMQGDLIHLELGMPAEDTPAHIKSATTAAMNAGHVHYSDLQGIPELRHAAAAHLGAGHGLDYHAGEVIVTNGLTHASFAAFMAFLDAGDEAILLEPYYPQHIGKIELAGARVVTAPLDAQDGFSIKRDLIAPHITPATKMIVLVNPCNPTGRVYTPAEVQVIADLAIEHDLLVLADEVYCDLNFGAVPHTSIAALPGMRERTISMFAFTKAYAMDGWRVGYLAACTDLIGPLMKITTSDVTHVNTFVQHGAVAALQGDPAVLQGLLAKDRARRDLVVTALNQMPHITCAAPQGTIYAFADISATGMGSQAFADALLEAEGVVVETGAFYGASGEGHIRICFGSATLEVLEQAMTRMRRFMNSL